MIDRDQYRAELEARAGIEPLDDLLYRRSLIVKRVAPLRAVYGSFGTADHLRKVELSKCRQAIRGKLTLEPPTDATGKVVRVTEDMLDEQAHTHANYIGHITTMTNERKQWAELEAELEEIDMRINRGQALLRYVASEPK